MCFDFPANRNEGNFEEGGVMTYLRQVVPFVNYSTDGDGSSGGEQT